MLVALTFARGISAEGAAGATPERAHGNAPIGGPPTPLTDYTSGVIGK